MRVLHVNRYFDTVRGGVERYIASAATAVSRLGAEVVVAAGDVSGQRTQERLTIRGFRGLGELARLVDRDFDIVHVHMPRNKAALAAMLFARRRGIPSVFTPHAIYPGGPVTRRLAKAVVDRVATRWMLENAAAVINLTPRDQNDCLAMGLAPERSVLLPNCIWAAHQTQGPASRCDVLPEGRFVLHVGRLHWQKNVPFLVRCMTHLADLRLVLVGQDQGDLDTVRTTATELGVSDRVIYLGTVPDAVVREALQRCACLVLASNWEGLPTVLLEVAAMGRPFAASDVGGNRWLVEKLGSGQLFQASDVDEAVRAICMAMTTPDGDLRKAREVVLRDFTWEANAAKLLDLYRSLSGRTSDRCSVVSC